MYSALEGIKVLDFTQLIAGPYCSMWMGDMGADVIKIENPARGDSIRSMGRMDNGDSYPFLMLNRNKRSLSIDMSKPEAKPIIDRLIDQSDVLLSGLRPGTLERYGFGFDAASARNSRLIYCIISGFGATGPYRRQGGYDLIAQAFSGMMSVTGDPDGAPARCGYPVLDVMSGSFALSGILAALRERDQTGKGQLVDVSLVESGLICSVWQAARYFYTGEVARSYGTGHPAISPYQVFRAGDGYFAVAIQGDKSWRDACRIMGLDASADDPRFLTGPDRFKNSKVLIPMMEERFLSASVDHWMRCFVEVDIPCGPVNTIDRAFENPHILEREMIMYVDHPEKGPLKTMRPPMRSSEGPARVHHQPPRLGENNRSVLGELGIADEEIRRFEELGVLGRPSNEE